MLFPKNTFPAPAKINLFLHIVGRRADQYHLLQSVFCLIDIYDQLTINLRDDGRIFRKSNNSDIPEINDLAIKAAMALKEYCKFHPPKGLSNSQISELGAEITIKKNIPIGAGLGGGSSDAATVILGLNKLWQLNFSNLSLQKIAIKLGADVPFFISGKNAIIEGIGEKITEISLPKSHYQQKIALLVPPIKISTAKIFNHKDLKRNTKIINIKQIKSEATKSLLFSLPKWKNDLQEVAEIVFPEIVKYRKLLRKTVLPQDSSQIKMSGSGSSYFCFYSEKSPKAPIFSKNFSYNLQPFSRKCFFRITNIIPKHPMIGI